MILIAQPTRLDAAVRRSNLLVEMRLTTGPLSRRENIGAAPYLDGQNTCGFSEALSIPPRKNKSLCENQKQSHIPSRPALPTEGVSRSLRHVARDAMDALLAAKRAVGCAYGQAVWSCPANAGDKPVRRLAGDGGNQAGSPRRSRSSRKPIAQGVPCDFGPA
jgi:hypothetical protein